MSRVKILISALIIFGVGAAFAGCKKNSATGDHCADIFKFRPNYYSVIIRPITASKCKLGDRVGFTRKERVELLRAESSRILKIYRNFTTCKKDADALEKRIDALSVDTFCNSPECVTDLAWSSYLTSLQGNGTMSRRFAGLENGTVEANASIRNIYAQIGVPESAIESVRLVTPEEHSSYEALSRTTEPSCRDAILESNRALFDNLVIELYDAERKLMTGTTPSGADVKKIGKLILLQASCVYGSTAPEGEQCATLSDPY
jgi:hypothetical protein